MPGIITSRTRSLYQRPPSGLVTLNYSCQQAQGLVNFWPLYGHQDLTDVIRQRQLTRNGTLFTVGGPSNADFAVYMPNNFTETLIWTGTDVTAVPLTLAGWVYRPVSSGGPIITVRDSVSNHRAVLSIVEEKMRVEYENASSASAVTSSVPLRQWVHACGVFNSATLRCVFMNGGHKVANTDSKIVNAFDWTGIGTNGSSAATLFIAHACIWSRALSDAEVSSLYDPATRWELYYPLGRKTYSFGASVAVVTSVVPQVMHYKRKRK